MNAEDRKLLKSLELTLKMNTQLLKWKLALKISITAALILLIVVLTFIVVTLDSSIVALVDFLSILLHVILDTLSNQFHVMLDKTTVVVQCDEINIKDKFLGISIDPYTPNCTFDFEFDN